MITDSFRESYKQAVAAIEMAGPAHAAMHGRIRDLRAGFQSQWGPKPPPVHLLTAVFISQGKPDGAARDLWFFSETHCMLSPGFTEGNRSVLRTYALTGKVIGVQVERDAESTDPGFTDATIWLQGHVNLTICARGANRALLEQLIGTYFVPNMR